MKNFTKLVLLFACSFFANGAMAQIVYVSEANAAAPVKDGTSWAKAYDNLQSALEDAALVAGDQIWVAKGTYYPSKKLDPAGTARDNTFVLKEGVKLYGGFAGNEISAFDLSTRNFTTNETILSGDFGVNDVTTLDANGAVLSIANTSDNAHHVVISYNHTAATVLDGFTIKGGSADGTGIVTVGTYDFAREAGAGIFSVKSSLTLRNLVIKNNYAATATNGGAGLYLGGGKENTIPTTSADDTDIQNVIFTNNLTNGFGGGLFVAGSSGYVYSVFSKNVTFNGNKALRGGGSYVANYAKTNFENASFSKNSSTSEGGAIYALGVAGKVTITQSEFVKNKGTKGGALHGNTSSTFEIKTTNFTENEGTEGGAVHGNLRSTFDIENCTFTENKGTSGGAIYAVSTAPNVALFTIKSSSFNKNNASLVSTGGGAIYATTASRFEISANTTFTENTSANLGGAIYMNTATSSLNVSNAMFIGNTANAAGAIYFINNVNDVSNTTLYKDNTISNTVFHNNKAGNGAAVTFGGAPGNVVNCTFYANASTAAGGGLRLTNSATNIVNVHNTILLANTAVSGGTNDISRAGGTLAITNSLTQGATGTNVVTNAVAADIFLSTNTADANFLKLKPLTGSPAIDAGDNSKIPAGVTTDLAGAARIYNTTVDLGAYENLSVLPITLSNFSASVKGSGVQLNWTTVSETNNSHFLLAQSADGINFTQIAKVATKGNGATYNHTDFSPATGVNYYRLTQVDNDGTAVTYDPIAVNYSLQAQAAVTVYPNPAIGGKITVNLADQKFNSLQLMNLNGQKLLSLTVNATDLEKTIDISNYPSGTYLIRLTDGAKAIIKKFVKP